MKKTLIITGIVLATVAAIGFAWYRQQRPSGKVEEKMYDLVLENLLQHSVPEISVAELASSRAEYTILDSRTIEEYKVSHIPGAIWVGTEKEEQLKKVDAIPTSKPIVVYCSVGLRSEQAAERLKDAGFDNVSNLYGGVFEWSNQLNPLVNEKGDTTDAIHGYSMIWAKWIRNGTVQF